MPDTSDRPLSVAGLAAAIGAGGVSGTGSKPVSVDNLKAVLESGGIAKVDLLWQGNFSSSSTASRTIKVAAGYSVFYAMGNWYGDSERLVMATVLPTNSRDSSSGEVSMHSTSGGTGQSVSFSIDSSGTTITVWFTSSSNPGARITKVYGIKL